jgi:hypothetical protein
MVSDLSSLATHFLNSFFPPESGQIRLCPPRAVSTEVLFLVSLGLLDSRCACSWKVGGHTAYEKHFRDALRESIFVPDRKEIPEKLKVVKSSVALRRCLGFIAHCLTLN